MNLKTNLSILLLIGLTLSSCVKNKGEVSYSYNKAIAQYANIEEIRNQDLVQSSRPIQNISKVFYGTDVILIGEKNKGIHVIDNTNRNIPTKPAFLNLPYCNEFYVDGNFLYAETHYDIVKIDLTNKSNPTLVYRGNYAISNPIIGENGSVLIGFRYEFVRETFQLNSPEELALRKANTIYFDYNNQLIPEGDVPPSFTSSNGKSKGTMSKMEIANHYLNLITGSSLLTYDISGNTIVKTQQQQVGTDLETIYHENNKLYIGSKSSMIIMNNSNPSAPTKISEYTHEVSCDPVLPNGNIAYLTLRSVDSEGCNGTVNLLKVLNVTNPSSPTEITNVNLRSPYGMTISNGRLFVGEGQNGLTVLDITNPTSPVEIHHSTAFKTFDVIKHPTDNDIILIISRNDIKQLQYNSSTGTIQELSSLLSL